MTNAKKSCWTCKNRKIGCDKTLPACNNCIRTNRVCAGFGVKLIWPEKYDGRRKSVIRGVDHQKSHNFCQTLAVDFLNTTTEDVEVSHLYNLTNWAQNSHPLRLSTRTLPTYSLPGFTSDEASLLSYYEARLARIITTVDDAQNGFRNELLPMALAHTSEASEGLMEAILALCAFHVGGPGHALHHKTRALQLLNQSLSVNVTDNLSTKLATCMLLCVYGVFDTTDGNWMIHLHGAKSLLVDCLANGPDGGNAATLSPFLRSWVLYHDVLAGFSEPTPQSDSIEMEAISLPEYTYDKTVIIGALACSEELLELIACINRLRSQRACDQSTIDALQSRLENLSQNIVIKPEQQSHSWPHSIDETRIRDTADFYYLAALIYFRRQILHLPPHNQAIQSPVESALVLIREMKVCTSPWPLFVVACEVQTDEQRLQILQTLQRMEEQRRIGNIGVTRMIVEALWKQRDLSMNDVARTAMDWRAIVDVEEMTPSFI